MQINKLHLKKNLHAITLSILLKKKIIKRACIKFIHSNNSNNNNSSVPNSSFIN